ncbi:hypothetical protein BSKO_12908 [Bryopsis sp. KO-2023]|nr:hypothetical protein BSKO_12908 [Bryopsis sp. KO-2023]
MRNPDEMNTSFQLYRGAKVGECLMQSLFELMETEKLSEEVADKVLSQFDKSMYLALDTRVGTKAQLRGKLKTYRYIDNVWQFVLEEVSLRLCSGGRGGSSGSEVKMESSKLICVDSKLVLKEKEEREGQEREAELLQQKALEVKLEETEEVRKTEEGPPAPIVKKEDIAKPQEGMEAKSSIGTLL